MIKNKIKILILLTSLFFSGNIVFGYETINIDGIDYTEYALVSSDKTGENVYKTLKEAVNSNFLNIIVDNGTFLEDSTIIVRKNNTKIIGKSKTTSIIRQKNTDKDLLQIYANNTLVKNISLDTKTYNAYARYVIGDGVPGETSDETLVGNNNTIDNCNILGGNKGFTLYIAGPTYKESIYTKYTESKLNFGNVIKNNYIEGKYIRDAFVFSLQKDGLVENNTFVGGELDVYMNRDSTIKGNNISNSNKTGIFLSGPSDNLKILNNNISQTKEHGIKSYYQIDNLPIPNNLKYISNFIIEGNNIETTGENGMDLNYFIKGSIKDNILNNIGVHGISFIFGSSENNIEGNKITNFGKAKKFRGSGLFFTVESSNNYAKNNYLENLNGNLEYAGIFVETEDSSNNTFESNYIYGSFEKAGIFSYSDNITNISNIITNKSGENIIIK